MGADIELRSLYSECHRQALFIDPETGFPVFDPNLESMYRARTYEVTADCVLYISDPAIDFDMVAESFVPFLDRVLKVLAIDHVTVTQDGRSWVYDLDRGRWHLTEMSAHCVNNCSFDFI
jgi:hypothetical protein